MKIAPQLLVKYAVLSVFVFIFNNSISQELKPVWTEDLVLPKGSVSVVGYNPKDHGYYLNEDHLYLIYSKYGDGDTEKTYHALKTYAWKDDGELTKEVVFKDIENLGSPLYILGDTYCNPNRYFHINDNNAVFTYNKGKRGVPAVKPNAFITKVDVNNVGVGVVDIKSNKVVNTFWIDQSLGLPLEKIRPIGVTNRSTFVDYATHSSDGSIAVIGLFGPQPSIQDSPSIPFYLKLSKDGKPIDIFLYQGLDWDYLSRSYYWVKENELLMLNTNDTHAVINLTTGEVEPDVNMEDYLPLYTTISKESDEVTLDKFVRSDLEINLMQKKIDKKEFDVYLKIYTPSGQKELSDEIFKQLFPKKKPKYTYIDANEELIAIASEYGFAFFDATHRNLLHYYLSKKQKKRTAFLWNRSSKIIFNSEDKSYGFEF